MRGVQGYGVTAEKQSKGTGNGQPARARLAVRVRGLQGCAMSVMDGLCVEGTGTWSYNVATGQRRMVRWCLPAC